MRSVSCAVFFVLAAGLGFTQPGRSPVPPADDVERSEKLVRELYKTDLAKKKTAELVDAARSPRTNRNAC